MIRFTKFTTLMFGVNCGQQPIPPSCDVMQQFVRGFCRPYTLNHQVPEKSTEWLPRFGDWHAHFAIITQKKTRNGVERKGILNAERIGMEQDNERESALYVLIIV